MNKRESLLEIFREFDAFIFKKYLKEKNLLDRPEEFKLGVKAVMEEINHSISHINYNLLRQITLLENKKNCFYFLYELTKIEIFIFFGALMETHLFIEFREKFEDTNTLTKNQKTSLLNKLNVLDDFFEEEEINSIISKINSDGNKVTERMVFENFLIKFCRINEKYSVNNNPTQKVIKSINSIINDYFNSEIKFSRGQTVNNYNLTFTSELGKIPIYLKNVE